MLIVTLFVFGIIAVVAYFTLSSVNDEIQLSDDLSNETKAFSQNVDDQFPSTFDSAFLMVLIFLWILLLASSFLIDTHPIFFVITVIVLVISFVVAMVVANTYTEFTGDAEFSTFAAAFPIMSWVMEHLLIVIMVMGFSSGVALYAKNQL